MEKSIPPLEFFEWVFNQKFDTERELLISMLNHTESWSNEITDPLKGWLFDKHGYFKTLPKDDPSPIVRAAQKIYFNKFETNPGTRLESTIAQMDAIGIPLFHSRYKLIKRTREFLDSIEFAKEFVMLSITWRYENFGYQLMIMRKLREGWENFMLRKTQLITEINRQIRRLDAPLKKQ
jgi:hypothetical protein